MRRLFRALLLVVSVMCVGDAARAEITVTDLTGHTITLEQPARRILINDGRFLMALSLIHPDPVSLLAAWPHDVHRIGPDAYAQFRATSPEIETLPAVAANGVTQSVEQILAARPDLAVFRLGSHLTDAQRASVEAAGIPVMVIDFFIHPLKNVTPSLRLLGQVTGATAQTERFIAFRQAQLRTIADRLADLPDSERPRVFLEPHAGITEDCCTSPGNGNIGDYIAFAGGDNIGRSAIPGAAGRLHLEYIITRAPEVYIATGGPHMEHRGGVVLGPGYTAEAARESLVRVLARPGFSELPAVRDGRVYGLSHQLMNSPLDILALGVLAKALHPALFADLDLDATKAHIEEAFSVIDMEGVYWTDLTGSRLR